MTPYQQEELENIRRAAERGKGVAEVDWSIEATFYVDTFVHILDTLKRIKNET